MTSRNATRPGQRVPGRPRTSIGAHARRGFAVAAAAGMVVAVGCGGGGDTESVASSEGQALYEVNCAMCHGERALGDGPMAASLPVEPPGLIEHLGHHSEAELFRLILGGVPPAMPPAALTEDQVRLVVDYTWTLVPDSLVDELREMQRMAEMGMDMSGMGMGNGAMDMPDSTGGTGPGRMMPRDTMRH